VYRILARRALRLPSVPFARLPATQRIFDIGAVPVLAKDQANCWRIIARAHQVIDSTQVKIHFACVLGFELRHLQIHNHEAMQAVVVKQQVQVVIFAVDLKVMLTAHKREASAKLEHEVFEVRQQAPLEVAFVHCIVVGQEVKTVRVFQNLRGQFRLRTR
jgi:hypothetical protein